MSHPLRERESDSELSTTVSGAGVLAKGGMEKSVTSRAGEPG